MSEKEMMEELLKLQNRIKKSTLQLESLNKEVSRLESVSDEHKKKLKTLYGQNLMMQQFLQERGLFFEYMAINNKKSKQLKKIKYKES